MENNIITPEILSKIAEVKSQLNEKVGAVEIPDSDGLVLVKIGSPEYKARKDSDFIMMFPLDHELVVCTG